MDNRVSGLLIVIIALFVLWVYDTGRLQDLSNVLKGTNSTTKAKFTAANGTFGTQFVPANTNPNSATLPNTPGGLGTGDLDKVICKAFPASCPYIGYINPAKNVINGTLGKIFGFEL